MRRALLFSLLAYFDALVAPNNLPNVILATVGIIGVIVAMRTLKWLKEQVNRMDRQIGLMDQQRTDSNQSSKDSLEALNRQITHLESQVTVMERQANQTSASASEAHKLMASQAELMARQAEIMERQTKLQEAAMTQWIDVKNWRVEVLQLIGPLSSIPKTLRVSYDVVNESTFPLEMRAEFKFSGGVSQYLPYVYLLPKKPYTIPFDLKLDEGRGAQYAKGEIRIGVHGQFYHVGVTTQPSPLMSIRGNLVCGRTAATRLEFEWLVKEKSGEGEEEQEAEAN